MTANPEEPYEHVGAEPSAPPDDLRERMQGPAAVRFAKTLGSKLQKRYHELPHVLGKPFAIALTDFHAPSSMVWSREALAVYLFGQLPRARMVDGERVLFGERITHLLGTSGFKAGLFCDDGHAELSAVIFTNACTIAKLSRVPVSSGVAVPGLRYARVGTLFDRTPGASMSVPFSFDITSAEYRELWQPYHREPWCAELEVYHNPYASHPIPRELIPEAQHWYSEDGEVSCKAFFKTSILKSRSIILNAGDPLPKPEQQFQLRDIDAMLIDPP